MRAVLFPMYGMSGSPLKQSGLHAAQEVVVVLAQGLSMFGSICHALNRSVHFQVRCEVFVRKFQRLLD